MFTDIHHNMIFSRFHELHSAITVGQLLGFAAVAAVILIAAPKLVPLALFGAML
jgi:hypothetical protein